MRKSDEGKAKHSDPPEEERRKYLKTVGALVAGLAVGGAAGWLSKPAERVEVPGATVTAPGATETVTKTVAGPTVTVTPTPAPEKPWIGDYLSAPSDPGWHQWPRVNPPYRIGLAIAWSGNPWRFTQAAETETVLTALKDIGWVEDWKLTNAGGDVLEQKRNIRELEEWGMDALIIDPVSPDALIEDIKRVTLNGVFTAICIESPLPEKMEHYGTIFQTNYFKSGYLQGKFVAEKLIEKYPEEYRKVAVIRGIAGAPSNIQRWEGAKYAIDQYPTVEIVAAVDSGWSPSKARDDAADIIAAHPNVRGWVTQGAMMMSSIPLALVDAGMDPGEHVMTGEDFVFNLKLQRQYGFEMLMCGNPQSQQALAIWRAIQGLQGIPVRKIDYFEPPVLTTEQLHTIWIEGLPDSAQLMSLLTPDQLRAVVGG